LFFQFWNIFFEYKNQYFNSENWYSNMKLIFQFLIFILILRKYSNFKNKITWNYKKEIWISSFQYEFLKSLLYFKIYASVWNISPIIKHLCKHWNQCFNTENGYRNYFLNYWIKNYYMNLKINIWNLKNFIGIPFSVILIFLRTISIWKWLFHLFKKLFKIWKWYCNMDVLFEFKKFIWSKNWWFNSKLIFSNLESNISILRILNSNSN
jgi:hypothetical protein